MGTFGFLVCDKPVGWTSRDVVNVIQGRVRPAKAGHAGTLDPLADGVLVVGVGPAVRLVPYVQRMEKRYRATFRLGAWSPSGDVEDGVRQAVDGPVPSRLHLAEAATRLTGNIRQTPPVYSAIKIGGERAYRKARRGERIEMPDRTVRVDAVTIQEYSFPNLRLEIACGSGTYIRTLGMDLAKLVGTVAVMTELTRTAVGSFRIQDAWTMEQIREDPLEAMLRPAAEGIGELPQFNVDEDQSRRLGHGQCIDGDATMTDSVARHRVDASPCEEAAAIGPDGVLRAIVVAKGPSWCPRRVFPNR